MLCRRITIELTCDKVFKRYKSHYLSDKWLKEPFLIGYPTNSNENERTRQELMLKLFPKECKTPYELYLQDKKGESTIEKWDKLDFEERNRYAKMAVRKSPRYIHPKPKLVRGFELFKDQIQVKTPYYAKKQWIELSDKERRYFTDSENIPFLYKERERIWKGYEIVEYLKRYSTENSWNPYPLSTLYPWEVIKDKLRSRKKVDEFELDYYDVLIREAFFRNYQRKAMHIYYTDLQHFEPGNYNYQQVLSRFKKLPDGDLLYYLQKQSLREKHALRTKAPMRYPGFRNFASQFESHSENPENYVAEITRSWDTLSTEEKDKHSRVPHRVERENYLDWKVGIVMDYIYYTGQVSGLDYRYDWRKEMNEKTNGFVYLKGLYAECII